MAQKKVKADNSHSSAPWANNLSGKSGGKGGDEKGVRTKRASLVLEVCKATEEATSEKRASKNTLVVTDSLRSRYIHY